MYNALSAPQSLYIKAIEFEKDLITSPNKKEVRIRNIFERAVSKFGRKDIGIWCHYAKFEMTSKCGRLGDLYRRVESMGFDDLTSFIQSYQSIQCD